MDHINKENYEPLQKVVLRLLVLLKKTETIYEESNSFHRNTVFIKKPRLMRGASRPYPLGWYTCKVNRFTIFFKLFPYFFCWHLTLQLLALAVERFIHQEWKELKGRAKIGSLFLPIGTSPQRCTGSKSAVHCFWKHKMLWHQKRKRYSPFWQNRTKTLKLK